MTGMCKEIFGRAGRMGACGSPGQDLSMIIKSAILSWYYTNCIYGEKPSYKTPPKKTPTIPFPWLGNIAPP